MSDIAEENCDSIATPPTKCSRCGHGKFVEKLGGWVCGKCRYFHEMKSGGKVAVITQAQVDAISDYYGSTFTLAGINTLANVFRDTECPIVGDAIRNHVPWAEHITFHKQLEIAPNTFTWIIEISQLHDQAKWAYGSGPGSLAEDEDL